MANDSQKKRVLYFIGPFTGAYAGGLFKPSAADEGAEPKYSLTLLIPKDVDPNSREGRAFDALRKAIDTAFVEKFGKADLEKFRKNIAPYKHYPIRDGDVERSDKAEFKNRYFLRASSKDRPGVQLRSGQIVTTPDLVWSGCTFVAQVGVFAYDKMNREGKSISKGVTLWLANAMRYAEGEKISGRPDVESAFSEWTDGGSGGGGESNTGGGGSDSGSSDEASPID
jgi:hypothetical protein